MGLVYFLIGFLAGMTLICLAIDVEDMGKYED